MPKKKRTQSGNIKPKSRKKHATYKGKEGKGKFLIFDRRFAMSALRLRNHVSTSSQRQSIIRRAKRYAPKVAEQAKKIDNNGN